MNTNIAANSSRWTTWLARVSLTGWRDSDDERLAIDGAATVLVLTVTVACLDGHLHDLWAWCALLFVAIRLAGEAVADRNRHLQDAHAEAGIDSPGQAIRAAEEMLSVVAVGQRARCDRQSARLWLTSAVYPFAALLYAASPLGNGKGMAWVHAQALQMADPDDAAVWRHAALEAAEADARMYDWLTRVADLDARQRASIGVAMREAVAARLESGRPR
ncbi:MAG: hypothetical protein K2X52_06615 [Mycobacteriaceae bacterium]|nr:hypothetical protein [Mycobacteriaceae bacterium]